MVYRIIIWIFLFLLPLHGFLVTVFQCKFGINTDFLRFWKELVVLGLLITLSARVLLHEKFSLKKIYKDNYLLWTVTAFTLCSLWYIYFPFFEIKAASILGFRYDVLFLFALLIGLYLPQGQKDYSFYLRMIFISTFGILIVFLPWYVFGDIAKTVELFGYSPEVSTYTANSCLSFSQNVDGHHRFQATFGGPIRFSVFITIVYILFTGYILARKTLSRNEKIILIWGYGALVLPSIFFSYSKTSALWFLFGVGLFTFLVRKFVFGKKVTKKFLGYLGAALSLPLLVIVILKWELFLHLGAVLNRLENLSKSVEMFFYNPIGYGLWIAGPASQIGNSIESAGNWQIATSSVAKVHRFLPENWYVQILLEQGIVGLALFMSIIILIGVKLWGKMKSHKDYMSVALFSAYASLCFMGLFTHVFEEAATSYALFFLIGIYLSDTLHSHVHKK